MDQPIIAVCSDASRYGCAIYSDAILELVADKRPGEPYKNLDIIIQRVDPEAVIISAAQRKLMAYLETKFDFGDNKTFKMVVVPNIWFSMSKGVQKLLDCELVQSKDLKDNEEKSFYIFSRVNRAADVCAIRAIAALDSYISSANDTSARVGDKIVILSRQASQAKDAEDPMNPMPILDVKYSDPGPTLSIDKSSFKSLNIFPDHDFSKLSDTDLNQQSLEAIPSLFEVLNQCQSPQGKKHLKTMMLWPIQDVDELRHRHNAVEYLITPENQLIRDQLAVQLKNVIPLGGLLSKLNHSVGSPKELGTIYKSLWAFVSVIDLIKANSSHGLEIFHRIVSADSDELRKTVDSIINIVDFESSKRERRIQVYIGIDQEVDDKKEIVRNLSKFCDEVAIEETVKYKDTLAKACRVIYIPRIGFLNSIEYSTTAELQRICASKEFDVLLHTEDSIYFKTQRMEELDDNAGDVACDLIDVQESVVINLQSDLLRHTEKILKLMELCGELDCLVAFAAVSFQRGYTKPDMVSSEEEFFINQVYHPLHSIRLNMIPNNIRFYKANSERRVKVMVITGPNSCGKTTYMKAACLTIYMAQIGCFVPAIHARVPPFDAILTRMHSANSVSTGLSSFATDLQQINYALTKATENSFIAIDEFGKGTQARDGFHLLKGLTSYFCSRGQASPYVMIATHFNRLIDHLTNYSEYIVYKTFKVVKDSGKDQIIYEYEIVDGISDASFAERVAMRAGVPRGVIERAIQIRDYITENRLIRPRPPQGA